MKKYILYCGNKRLTFDYLDDLNNYLSKIQFQRLIANGQHIVVLIKNDKGYYNYNEVVLQHE